MDFHNALLWEKKGSKIQCNVCNRHCLIAENSTGFCRVRKNIDGKLVSLNYGKNLTWQIDHIEKKSFYHFKPGSYCLGVSTLGCNFKCRHCQNFDISIEWSDLQLNAMQFSSPEQVVQRALDANVSGIAYTYTEPTIFLEYALDIMKLAKEKGLYNVWVSNGYFTKEAFELIRPYLDAINIDLKGDEDFYRNISMNIDLEKIKSNIRLASDSGIHLEVTNLIVPTLNDSEKHFKDVSEFIFSVSKEIPLHFTAFFPYYKMRDLPRTKKETLEKAKVIAKRIGLKYVYIGNVGETEKTVCPECNAVLIERTGSEIELKNLEKNKCRKCGTRINLVP